MKTFALCSQGCCGSTKMVVLLKEIGLKRITPKDKKSSYNVHTRHVPPHFDGKMLFMYGDPRNILISSLNHSKNNAFIHSHCFYMNGVIDTINAHGKLTIEGIIERGNEPLKLEEHFKNWMYSTIDYPLMMLKYESLEDPKAFEKVLDFFDIKGDYIYEWIERKSSYKKLPEDQQLGLSDMFKNLLDIQEQLPPWFIR